MPHRNIKHSGIIVTSEVDVVNMALAEIGTQSSISDLSEDSPEAITARLIYKPKLHALMRAAHWNCHRKQGYLTQLKAVVINGQTSDNPPPRPWMYEYAYPEDCIQARFILPYWNLNYTGTPFTTASEVVPVWLNGPPVRFVVATDINTQGNPHRVILTNMAQAILVYTWRNENPDLWDPQFLAAFVATLGAYFVNPLNRDRALLQDQFNIARSIIIEARVSDGNEGLTSADHLPDWMRVRMMGANDMYIGNEYFYGWSTMAFPGGYSV